MKKEPIAILLGYFTRQMELIEEILKEIHATKPSKRAETTHLAYLLHNLYCSVDLGKEIMLERFKLYGNQNCR